MKEVIPSPELNFIHCKTRRTKATVIKTTASTRQRQMQAYKYMFNFLFHIYSIDLYTNIIYRNYIIERKEERDKRKETKGKKRKERVERKEMKGER